MECGISESNPFEPLPCQFSNLLFSDLFSDFTLIVPNAPSPKLARIPVHRFLLASCSEYFASIFKQMEKETELTVCFSDWSVSAVELVLTEVYLNSSLKLTNENVAAVLTVACVWRIKPIIAACKQFILERVAVQQSLSILARAERVIEDDPTVLNSLVSQVIGDMCRFESSEFSTLSFKLFMSICQRVYYQRADDAVANALCGAIETYVTTNLKKFGSYEFDQLVKMFTMKTAHNGIITLYKIGLDFKWDTKLCETKILHAWRWLDPERLSKLPVKSLQKLISSNFLNVKSEDALLDFVCLVAKNQPDSPDIHRLMGEVRVGSLSDEYQQKYMDSPHVPEAKRMRRPSVLEARRLARADVKCLLLGACDDAALEDLKSMLVRCQMDEERLTAVRADKPYQVDFSEFHTIVVFGFYKLWNCESLSKALYTFHNDGGGLIIAYGANRMDEFGIGEPLRSALPIEKPTQCDIAKMTFYADSKAPSVGCKNMRQICKARDDGVVESYWDDGYPFAISKKATKDEGGIVVLNAIPVSSDIIPGQWSKANKSMTRLLVSSIVSVASVVYSRRNKE